MFAVPPRVAAKIADPLAAVDADIWTAWLELGAARRQWTHSPNAATTRVAVHAEAHLNRLLEHRHKLTRR